MPSEQPPASGTPSTLIFACSGAADVGEIADRTARTLAKSGHGGMFCLAAVGARIPDLMDKARAAKKLLVIDGCDKDCGRTILHAAGLDNFIHLRVTDCGLAKGQSPPSAQNIAAVADRAAEKLA